MAAWPEFTSPISNEPTSVLFCRRQRVLGARALTTATVAFAPVAPASICAALLLAASEFRNHF
jgi:hypothetical protein